MQQAYDLFLFIGQSNMAGRGVSSPRWPEGAPELTPGAGFEYRSVSAPEQLFPIQEPFGAAENDPNGIFEPGMKTGSLVTAFVNAYYAQTHTPIIGVSASKGGSAISAWQGQNDYLSDALARLQRAQCYMQQHGLPLRHCFALWCQGETDGDLGTPAPVYRQKMEQMLTLGGRCYLVGTVLFFRAGPMGEIVTLTAEDLYTIQQFLETHSVTLMYGREKLCCLCME